MRRGVRPVGMPQAVLAHVPEALTSYADIQQTILNDGVVDAGIKEMCARYLAEDDDVVAHARDPERFTERERAALAWAHAVGWNADEADDELWERLQRHFTEPELVELGYAMHVSLGMQHFMRALGIANADRPG